MPVVVRFSVLLFVAALALVGAGSPLAAQDRPPRIIETWEAIYPQEMLVRGVDTGEVRVMVAVDSEGRMFEHLVTAYTLKPFAEAAVTALQRWRFEPALRAGQPIAMTFELQFHFRSEGVVVSQTASENLEGRILALQRGRFDYHVWPMRELDAVPIPRKTVRPHFPAATAARVGAAVVEVEFFIDEQGRVRMPALRPGADPELGYYALEAVRQWEFEPATRKGRPVPARVVQGFQFGAAAP